MSFSSSQSTPTVALFGGTGGTGLAFLQQFLASSPSASINVLVRTPAKLSTLQSQYLRQLHLVQGDIRLVDAIKICLVQDGRLVDMVVSSIGMVIERKGLSWVSNDPTICHDGTVAILQALEELEADSSILPPASGQRTKLVVVSTTGISSRGRDIPISMMPLYHWLLREPHEDKKKMEQVIEASQREWVAVRPSWLVDGEGKGLEGVRSSTEGSGSGATGKHAKEDVAIGYAIARIDVAKWILHACLLTDEVGWRKWAGKKVTITY